MNPNSTMRADVSQAADARTAPVDAPGRRRAPRGRRHPIAGARATALRLFFTCWCIFVLHFATNTVREIYPALAIADRLSFDVAEYKDFHPDIFELTGRGAFINNNPGASLMAAVPYAMAKPVIDRATAVMQQRRSGAATAPADTYDSRWPMARQFVAKARERGLDVKFGLGAVVMQALLMAPLSALATVVMFHVLRHTGASRRTAVLLALLYAFATPVLYRTAQLNQNLIVAHCAFFAFALLWRPWDAADQPKSPRYFLAGLLAGWCVVCDYSGVIVVLVLSMYGLIRRMSLPPAARQSSDALRYLAGLAICAAVLMGYQWVCFGNPLLPAQAYMPQPAHGYSGMTLPSPDLFWRTAFDLRFGLFTAAPLLLLALCVPLWVRSAAIARREQICIVALTLALFTFCSSNQYGYLQFNTGVRHVVPVVPFLFILVAQVLLRISPLPAVLVGIVTTYWSWCLAMHRDVENPIGVLDAIVRVTLEGFRLPWLVTLQQMGYLPAHASPLALFAICGAILWAVWRIKPQPQPIRPS